MEGTMHYWLSEFCVNNGFVWWWVSTLATIRSFWYISISICCKICRSKVLELGHKISTELIKAQFTLILLPWDSVIRVYLFVKRGRMWPAKYSICVWCLVTAIWIFLGCIWIWKSNHDGLLADASPRPEPGRYFHFSCRRVSAGAGPIWATLRG